MTECLRSRNSELYCVPVKVILVTKANRIPLNKKNLR